MLNLNQLARYRVHLLMGAFLLAWFAFTTFINILDGANVLWAIWASIKTVKPMELVSVVCIWMAMASLVKENYKLRAKIQLLESRQ